MALGLPFLLCADPDAPNVASWSGLANDVGLVEAAALFGIRLRALHPRSAAAGVDPRHEFALHFRDSYVPLIRRALAHNQTVLCWRGWPDPMQYAWGLVTDGRADSDELTGKIAGCAQPLPLATAALQCYVVEEVNAQLASPADVLACGATAVARLHEECAAAGPHIAGAFSWHLWCERLSASAHAAQIDDHRHLAIELIRDRNSGLRWLTAHAAELPGVDQEAAILREQLAAIVECLLDFTTALPQEGSTTLRDRLSAAAEAEQRSVAALQQTIAGLCAT